jgi:autophagy-related protein 11
VHAYYFSGLLGVLDDLEEFARSSNDAAAIGAVRESRAALEKLVNKMDSFETGFDRIAERSCKLLIEFYQIMN